MKRGASTKEHWDKLAQLVKADGCTSAPDFWFTNCCNQHDVFYRTGKDEHGNAITRAEADKRFRICLRADALTLPGRLFFPWLYWSAVRVFGARHWNRKEKAREKSNETGDEISTG